MWRLSLYFRLVKFDIVLCFRLGFAVSLKGSYTERLFLRVMMTLESSRLFKRPGLLPDDQVIRGAVLASSSRNPRGSHE